MDTRKSTTRPRKARQGKSSKTAVTSYLDLLDKGEQSAAEFRKLDWFDDLVKQSVEAVRKG